MKIVINDYDNKEVDVFCNDQKIQDIKCKIFIIHGQKDKLINIDHCRKMVKKVKQATYWFPSEGDHNNIINCYRVQFYNNCKKFICSLETNRDTMLTKNEIHFQNYNNFSFQSRYIMSKVNTEEKIDIKKNDNLLKNSTGFLDNINKKIDDKNKTVKQ